ncbi:hypothetical protein TEA_006231 [Camellia sinensis var. sinensis]|uniref:Uncharacterized protein n=1 Tax=Camellia sinensis var. sinensis TaxID=542762 RepID=A0A4S4DBM0_CAMSN|nr:hypothetical protein TEA_006231 [Camellia sinensis var. sinensis]
MVCLKPLSKSVRRNGEVWPTIFRQKSSGESFAGDEEDEGERQPGWTRGGLVGKNRKGAEVERAGVRSRVVAEMEGKSRDKGLREVPNGPMGHSGPTFILGPSDFYDKGRSSYSPRAGPVYKQQMDYNVGPQSVDEVYSAKLGLVGQLKGVHGSEERIHDADRSELLVEERRSIGEEEAQRR